ncbi:hypothetical protein AURDEDRAFT_176823 [Auricularia subglabra TFB-10046 SS5]|uniref:Uncharacterized protein n=1 Tax=Auricularia subglabra (strain TFB-10046 / SS5) TaxID=717982 RepID=J0LCA7_AURST|nr:hypothetical protein AURDEDRAFT_176823 [Auricularia subglabra TFB-10046 SS5]
MSFPPCNFCHCQEFAYYPPPNTPPEQLFNPPAILPCVSPSCGHAYREHGDIPPALDCAVCPQRCGQFVLATLGQRLSDSLCLCGHPWADHKRPPATAAPPQPRSGPQRLLAPPPSSAGATSGILHTVTAERFLLPYNQSLGLTATTSGATQNQQRVDSHERKPKAKKGKKPLTGVVPGGVTAVQAGVHATITGVVGARTAPPPAVHAFAPTPSSSSAAAARASSAVHPDIPPANPVIVFPCDVTDALAFQPPFPSLQPLGLRRDINRLKLNPILYDHFVQSMTKFGLSFRLTLPPEKCSPGNDFHDAVTTSVIEHLDSRGIHLHPESASQSHLPKFKILRPRASGSNVMFKPYIVSQDVLTVQHITSTKGIAGKKQLLLAPADVASQLLGPVNFAQLSVAQASAFASLLSYHYCFALRVIEYLSLLASTTPALTPGLCSAICSAMHPAPRQQPDDELDLAFDPDFPDFDSQSSHSRSSSAMQVDNFELTPSPRRALFAQPAGPSAHSRPASPVSHAGPPFFSPTPAPRTPGPSIVPFAADHPDPLHLAASPSLDLLPRDAARLLADFTALAQAPLFLSHCPALSPTPSPPAEPTYVPSDTASDRSASRASGTRPADQSAALDYDSDVELIYSFDSDYSNSALHHAAFHTMLTDNLPKPASSPDKTAALLYTVPGEKPDPSLGFVMSAVFRGLMSHRNDPDYVDVGLLEKLSGPRNLRVEHLHFRNLSMRQLFCVPNNFFRVHGAFGVGVLRSLASQTLLTFACPDPTDGNLNDYIGLWTASGSYMVPTKLLSTNPNTAQCLLYAAAGAAAGYSLVQLGYIPVVHPALLLILLVSHYLNLDANDPTVIALLVDSCWLAHVDPPLHQVLSLFPNSHKAPIPPRDSSPAAAALHTRLADIGFNNPSHPRTAADHRQLTLALYSVAILGVNLTRQPPPPEWKHFLRGFNRDLSFVSKNKRKKAQPDFSPFIADLFFQTPPLTPPLSEGARILRLRRILLRACCPPAFAPEVTQRVLTDEGDSPLEHELLQNLRVLFDHYIFGTGHPPDVAAAIPPRADPLALSLAALPNFRPSLFVSAVNGTHFLPPCSPEETDYHFHLKLRHLHPEEIRPAGDVQAIKFSTCFHSMLFPVTPGARDSLYDLVDRSLHLLRAAQASPSFKPGQRPDIDTPFCNFLHSQLLVKSDEFNTA